MSYHRTASFLSHSSSREVIPPCTTWPGGRRDVPVVVMWGKASSSLDQDLCVYLLCCGHAQRLFSFCCFCLALQIGDLQAFGMNFPRLDLPQLELRLAVLASHGPFLQSIPRSCCHDFTQALLALSDPACLLQVSSYSSVSASVTPLILKLHFTHVAGGFHEDSPTASPPVHVSTATG